MGNASKPFSSGGTFTCDTKSKKWVLQFELFFNIGSLNLKKTFKVEDGRL